MHIPEMPSPADLYHLFYISGSSVYIMLSPKSLKPFPVSFPCPGHRVILDSAAPGAMIAVVLFACLLLQKIHQLHGESSSLCNDAYAVCFYKEKSTS